MKGRKTLRETYAENNRSDRMYAALHGKEPHFQAEIAPVREYVKSGLPSEDDIKNAIVTRLRARSDVAWLMRINSGTMIVDDRSIRFYFLYLRGFPATSKGVSDIVGQKTDGRCFGLEVKTPERRNTETEDQRKFLDAVNQGGGVGRIVVSVDEAERALNG